MLKGTGARWTTKLAAIGIAVILTFAAPLSAFAAATSFTIIEKVPFSTVFEGCGDIISIDGEIQHVLHVTLTGTGKLAIQELFHPQGLTGVGLLSGATYHAVGGTKNTATIGVAATFTSVNNFKMISAGTTPNYMVHETSHTTFNALGEITASTDNFSVECRG